MRYLLPFVAILLAACATQNPYGYQQPQPAYGGAPGPVGTVQEIRYVENRRESGIGLGTLIGAAAGAALGSRFGEGSGKAAATVGGAIAGGAAGNQISNQRNSSGAFQYYVALDDGRYATVTQVTDYGIRQGDRVQIVGEEIRPY